MEIIYKKLGANKNVTGSKHFLELGKDSILIDCGLYQGPWEVEKKNWEELDIDLAKLKAVVLTHAHLDHSGYIPRLYKKGFKGDIYSTYLTSKLATIVIEDSASIMAQTAKKNAENMGKKSKYGELLYSEAEVNHSLKRFIIKKEKESFTIGAFTLKFHRAGHIPGASLLEVFVGNKSLLFSGDLGRQDDILMKEPDYLDLKKYDYVFSESTYGNREREPQITQYDEVLKLLKERKSKGSSILIASFAIARTQGLMYLVDKVLRDHPELEVDCFLDSPMGIRASEAILSGHDDSFQVSKEDLERSFLRFKFCRESWESNELFEKDGPRLIISSSGMLSGGRVLKHFSKFAENEDDFIFLPGYQGEGTLGRSLIAGEKKVSHEEKEIEVKATIVSSMAFSSHADQGEILDFISHVSAQETKVILSHGEVESMAALKEKIIQQVLEEDFLQLS
ncbi:MAG: MBL fold metallo-hydrolase [Oligoflexia bacterium]|nr:MBL fold metallo-hydrolase [Oligoflexia bacterium]